MFQLDWAEVLIFSKFQSGICTKASSSEENLYILYPSMMDDEVFGADAKIFQDAITDLESLIKFFYNYSAFTIPGVK